MKIVLGVVAAVVVLIVAAVVLLALFFDANDYRDQIAAKVQQATGRTLQIGSIHLSVFPTLGLKLSDTKLGNAKGFGDTPFAEVGEADVGVRLLPLIFDRKLEVGTVYLSDLKLDLEKHADGTSNWDDLAKGQGGAAPAKTPAKTETSPGGNPLAALDVGGINVENASIQYHDAQAKRDLSLQDFNLSVDALKPNTPCEFRTQFKTQVSQPAVAAEIQASGKLNFDLQTQRYQLQGFTLQVDASGKAIPGGKQTVKLAGDVDFDGAQHTARLADTQINVAGVTAHLSVQVSGIGTKDLKYSGPFKIDPFSPRDTLDALKIAFRPADADALKQASFSTQLSGTSSSAALKDVKLKLDQTNATGSIGVSSFSVPAADFDLKVDSLDVDHYMPVAKAGDETSANASKAPAGSGDDTPIPVQALDNFTAKGSFSIGKLVLHGMKMNDVTMKLSAIKGAAKTVTLNANLYKGSVASTTTLTAGSRPTYKTGLKLTSIDLGPLMKDATGKEPADGTGTVTADLTSAGATVGAVKRALDGTVAVKLDNGAINGFNLGQILRGAQSLMDNGAQAVASGSASSSDKTDFTTLSASGTIANGVLTSNDLSGASPLLRLAGAGTVDLVQQNIDYTLKPTVVNTATGQGGKSMDNLRGIEIPVHITGPFSAPKYRLDLAAALKQKATQKLQEQVDKQKGKLEQKLQDKLKGLFGQ